MNRSKIPLELQVRVFFRDQWLCHWCHRPTIFGPAIKYLEQFVRDSGYRYPLSYFHKNWRRDASPLLDDLGAVIDHLEAHSHGGKDSEENLVTACNKCNMRKSDKKDQRFVESEIFHRVKGHYGDPEQWDGLTSTFVVLSAKYSNQFTLNEKQWLRAIQGFLSLRESTGSRDG
jgi:5-methylcytosine-specific restriction endonuclease McrA